MASFMANAIARSGGTLPQSPANAFSDDDGNVHEDAIDSLAAADVVGGVARDRYGPSALVSRGQMASFLARAWLARTGTNLPDGDPAFSDVSSTTHEDNVNRVAAAGLAAGMSDGRFNPAVQVTRAQMATFVARFLGKLVADGHAEYPPADPQVSPEPSTAADVIGVEPVGSISPPLDSHDARRQFEAAVDASGVLDGWSLDEGARCFTLIVFGWDGGNNFDLSLLYHPNRVAWSGNECGGDGFSSFTAVRNGRSVVESSACECDYESDGPNYVDVVEALLDEGTGAVEATLGNTERGWYIEAIEPYR